MKYLINISFHTVHSSLKKSFFHYFWNLKWNREGPDDFLAIDPGDVT